jgi:Calx-beta domain/FG-GAP-like repeat
VTRSGGTAAFDVNFATADGSATVADHDYVASAGTLHFGDGVNTQTISITINGDVQPEFGQTFLVNLSGATNGASISDGQGVGTIANDDPIFATPTFQLAGFAPGAGGWVSDNTYPRELADVNGDGMADIVGFGDAGVYVSLATGGGNFAAAPLHVSLAGFGPSAGGWVSEDRYPRELADVNGDGMADIVGFGEDGVYVSLATGGGNFGAAPLHVSLAAFGPSAGGWVSEDRYPRELADVNGDGMADIVGFGEDGVYVSLATGGGNFGPSSLKLAAFGPSAGGWVSQDHYPRELADVNGDGMADIVGFGETGVYVALATGGGNFGPASFKFAGLGTAASGWSSDDRYPRELADLNHDGMADIVGFGEAGVYVAFAAGGGNFATPVFDLQAFAPGAGGWSSENTYPRHLADINHDGTPDIVGFGQAGVYEALSNGFHLI